MIRSSAKSMTSQFTRRVRKMPLGCLMISFALMPGDTFLLISLRHCWHRQKQHAQARMNRGAQRHTAGWRHAYAGFLRLAMEPGRHSYTSGHKKPFSVGKVKRH